MKLYAIYDKIGENYLQQIFVARNGAEMIRANVGNLMGRFPLRDLELHEIGEFKDKIIAFDEIKKIEWNSYKMPETKAEALEPLQISEEFKKILDKEENAE